MTSKQRKHFANIIGICGLVTFLGGCQNDGQETTQPTIQEPNIQDTTSLNTSMSTQEQKLQVSGRCIGCGHCVRIAGDTFAMQGRKAEVISQKQINSPAVQQAKSACPVQAIEIIEA